MRNSTGRKLTRVKGPVHTENPSIQGQWTDELDLTARTFTVTHQ
jgi:hypothetical protein